MNVKSKYKNQLNKSKKKIKIKIKKDISESSKPKTIIIQSPMAEQKMNSKIKIHYPINNILEEDFKKIPETIENIVVCVYRINTSKNNYATSFPYLEYLLYKYPPSSKNISKNMLLGSPAIIKIGLFFINKTLFLNLFKINSRVLI